MKISGRFQDRSVSVDDRPLDAWRSQQLVNHSPDGFAWGYGGSGPAQLALALLLTVASADTAVALHQQLKWDFVAPLPESDFDVEFDLEAWLSDALSRQRAGAGAR